MVFIPCPNVIEVDMLYTLELEPCENVYHVSYSAAPDQAALNALATVFQNWENTNASPSRSNQCALRTIRLRDLASSTGQELIHSVTPPISGANTANVAPNNVTIATAMRSGLAGRSNRGRSYWIGITDVMYSANLISPTIEGQIIAAYQALITALSGNGTPLVVLSKYSGVDPSGKPIPRAAGVHVAVSSVSMDITMDSQRRRLPGHNRHR